MHLEETSELALCGGVVVLSPDGNTLALPTGEVVDLALAWSPAGDRLVSAGSDIDALVWDAR